MSFLSVALFDFFFVPPRFSFAVDDSQYLVIFAVMLAVALITGGLTASLRQQAEIASSKEARTRALYEMARELSGASTLTQLAETLQRFLADIVHAKGVVFIAGAEGKLQVAGGSPAVDLPIVELAYTGGEYIHLDTNGYFPLRASGDVRGVMAVSFQGDILALEEHRALLEAVASLVAIVVERLDPPR